jgi:hypothetical protein
MMPRELLAQIVKILYTCELTENIHTQYLLCHGLLTGNWPVGDRATYVSKFMESDDNRQ